MSYLTPAEHDVAERFPHNVAGHVLTVLRDDGLYRHLRCARPSGSGFWFEVLTWPGTLAVRGEQGGYLFSRQPDMFEFFRGNRHSAGINPGCWAEKLPGHGLSVRVYSRDVLHQELADAVAAYEAAYPGLLASHQQQKDAYEATPDAQRRADQIGPEPRTPHEIRELIATYDAAGDLEHPRGARQLLDELEHFRVVSNTQEWNLTDWSDEFLWMCHAIVWAIDRFDARPAKPTVTVPAADLVWVLRSVLPVVDGDINIGEPDLMAVQIATTDGRTTVAATDRYLAVAATLATDGSIGDTPVLLHADTARLLAELAEAGFDPDEPVTLARDGATVTMAAAGHSTGYTLTVPATTGASDFPDVAGLLARLAASPASDLPTCIRPGLMLPLADALQLLTEIHPTGATHAVVRIAGSGGPLLVTVGESWRAAVMADPFPATRGSTALNTGP